MAPPAEQPTAPGSSSNVLQSVVEELQREDQQLLFPLLSRINETAEAITQGRSVDPVYIEEAIRLWKRYVDEVHQPRVERLAGVFRSTFAPPVEARRKTSHRPHLRASVPAEAHVETSQDRYNEIRGTQTRMSERIAVLEGLVAAYRRNEYYSPQMLASLLRSGAFSDRAWAQYEEEFVRQSLTGHVAHDEEVLLREEVTASDELRAQVQADFRRFLARPIEVRSTPS